MLRWIGRMREIRRLRRSEADELIAAHGGEAYAVARQLMRLARSKGDRHSETYFAKVAGEIARRTGKVVGLDTASRYLEK